MKTQLENWNSSFEISKLKAENAELRKDKERLDWMLSYEGNYWLLHNREDIDREMEEEQ